MKEKHELERSYDQIAAKYAAAFAREHTERDCFFLCHHSPDTGRGGGGFARICASLTAGWLPLTRLSWGRGRNPFFGMVWTARGYRRNARRGRGNGAVCASGGIVRRGGSRAAPLCFEYQSRRLYLSARVI